ncbi:hypothetical protein [Hyalangium versicolor]|uniref:hypothetical protein n=1 Tax=Hyalangium versicolor TaxID=2861190 RepID=UPI001CCE97FC|nr:hypothetical protein [Hyalangium versicolor]
MVCSVCQQGECFNPAHSVTTPPARDRRGWRIAPGLCSAWLSLIGKYCLDLSDSYTLEKVNEIYYRSGGLNFGSGSDALWTHKRAAGGELHTVIRYAREVPEEERCNICIRFVPEVNVSGSRTPDFVVLVYLGREVSRSEHVEVRTLTQAKRQIRVQQPGNGAQNQPLVLSESAIERKIFHGQINPRTPGVIVFHLPFAPLDAKAFQNWQALLDRIRLRRSRFPTGLHRIEVTTGTRDATTDTRRMLVFEQAKQWKGFIKDQYQ